MFAIVAYTLKFVLWDLVVDILRWPVWWYTDGVQYTWHRVWHWISGYHHRIGLGIWIKNWLRPMYAQYDWQGRLISFFFRTITIVFKAVQFLVGLVIFVLLFLLYLLLPIIAVVFLLLQLSIITLPS